MGFLSSKKTEVAVKKVEIYGDTINREKSTTYIGKTVKIKGQITSREDMSVEGWIKGSININKTLTIERGGRVKADIEANSVQIKGIVKGKIVAVNKIEIFNNGICEGDIETDKLVVKEGAILLGTVNINNETPSENIEKEMINEAEPEVKEEIISKVEPEICEETLHESDSEIIEGEVIEKSEDEQSENNVKEDDDVKDIPKEVPVNKKKKKQKKSKKK